MKANELRIGNFVKHKDSNLVYTVSAVYTETINLGELNFRYTHWIKSFNDDDKYRQYYHDKDDNYAPIPLTEEWLIKFGFKKILRGVEYSRWKKDILTFWWDNLMPGINTVGELDIRTIDTVHELQNLYFAITGQELTFTP